MESETEGEEDKGVGECITIVAHHTVCDIVPKFVTGVWCMISINHVSGDAGPLVHRKALLTDMMQMVHEYGMDGR